MPVPTPVMVTRPEENPSNRKELPGHARQPQKPPLLCQGSRVSPLRIPLTPSRPHSTRREKDAKGLAAVYGRKDGQAELRLEISAVRGHVRLLLRRRAAGRLLAWGGHVRLRRLRRRRLLHSVGGLSPAVAQHHRERHVAAPHGALLLVHLHRLARLRQLQLLRDGAHGARLEVAEVVPAREGAQKRVKRDLHAVAALRHVLQEAGLPKGVVDRLLHVLVLQLPPQHVRDLSAADGAGAVRVQLPKHLARLLDPHVLVARLQHLPVHLARHELCARDQIVVHAKAHLLQQVNRLVASHLEPHTDEVIRQRPHLHRFTLEVQLLHQLAQHLRI
mmetsp:Transcript_9205/g.23229  ORF Transcript_9205/g.23229 Transcript_9205/m.23229 type:complete len:332 (-) Transcript_9205:53-1048(-)